MDGMHDGRPPPRQTTAMMLGQLRMLLAPLLPDRLDTSAVINPTLPRWHDHLVSVVAHQLFPPLPVT